MLTIRLSRIGKKKKPMYRLVISEKTKDPYGRALEILGTYNPFTKEVDVKQDRIKHWISKGAGMSATVNNLLINNKIIEGKKQKSYYPKKKKKDESSSAKASPSTKATEDKPAEVKKEEKAEVKEIKKEDPKSEDKTEKKPK